MPFDATIVLSKYICKQLEFLSLNVFFILCLQGCASGHLKPVLSTDKTKLMFFFQEKKKRGGGGLLGWMKWKWFTFINIWVF